MSIVMPPHVALLSHSRCALGTLHRLEMAAMVLSEQVRQGIVCRIREKTYLLSDEVVNSLLQSSQVQINALPRLLHFLSTCVMSCSKNLPVASAT